MATRRKEKDKQKGRDIIRINLWLQLKLSSKTIKEAIN